ncbi:MAG: Clp protease N-terminal domain-containing protein [Candidatus Obscuribacterales bacterium]|jgi:ATP-dependent Clp protease ATP-binding subunit ClpC
MLQKLNQLSINVLLAALQEAKSLGHSCVATEHLLLGLVGDSTTMSGKLLNEAGANLSKLRVLVKVRKTVNNPMLPLPSWLQWLQAFQELPLSVNCKKTLDLALQEADGWREDKISPEHLLLALLTVPDSGAIEILKLNSIAPEEVRGTLIEALEERAGDERKEQHND